MLLRKTFRTTITLLAALIIILSPLSAVSPIDVAAAVENTFKIYYYRIDQSYTNAVAHVWRTDGGNVQTNPVFTASINYPGWAVATITTDADSINFKICPNGPGNWNDAENGPANQDGWNLLASKGEIFIISGDPSEKTLYTYNIYYHRNDMAGSTFATQSDDSGWAARSWTKYYSDGTERVQTLYFSETDDPNWVKTTILEIQPPYDNTQPYDKDRPWLWLRIGTQESNFDIKDVDTRQITIEDNKLSQDFYFIEGDAEFYKLKPPIESAPPENTNTYTVYYYRYDQNYAGWNLWTWSESNKDGQQVDFSTNGAPAGWSRLTFTSADSAVDFLVRKGNWEGRDVTSNRTFKIPEGQISDTFWLIEDDKEIYPTQLTIKTKIKSALSDDNTSVVATLTDNIPSDFDIGKLVVWDIAANKALGTTTTVSRRDNSTVVDIKIIGTDTDVIDPHKSYQVRYTDAAGNPDDETCVPGYVTMKGILDTVFYTGDDLGSNYTDNKTEYNKTDDKTTFKVWAPTAKEISVIIYNNEGDADGRLPADYFENGKVKQSKLEHHEADGDNNYSNNSDNAAIGKGYKMVYNLKTGVHSVTVEGDLLGHYYMYKVEQNSSPGTYAYAVDPYAVATSANGQMTAIVNVRENDGDDVELGSYPADYKKTDEILYEMHIRDFSINPNSGVTQEDRGKFSGIKTGTAFSGDSAIKTGIDHLVELGITTVHLLPVFDFASVNELNPNLTEMDTTSAPGQSNFNWGYDPQNYNVPEGSYSTEPTIPVQRIDEFKQLVKDLHNAGIRVVMDVVYNHTYSVDDGPFEKLVPTYFYRTNAEGKLTDASGCGNEVATEKKMVRKYIIDSVLYWQKEYGIDGFRFDLMSIIDGTTMTQLVDALQALNPNVLVYGEPWAAGTPAIDEAIPITSETFKSNWSGNDFAIFDDAFREAVKGKSDDSSKGFATENTSYKGSILGGVYGSNNRVTKASEAIHYVTAHDNLNLWDKIRFSFGMGGDDLKKLPEAMAGDNAYFDIKGSGESIFTSDGNGNIAIQSDILSTGILMTSQGIPFFQAGDEFLRTKHGDHNSYNANDGVNAIDWSKKKAYIDIFKYYQGLIAIRRAHPAFRMEDFSQIQANITNLDDVDHPDSGKHGAENLDLKQNIVAFKINGKAVGDSWDEIYVIYNGGSTNAFVRLGAIGLHVAANHLMATTAVFGEITNSWGYDIPPRSLAILYNSKTTGELDHIMIDPRTASRIDHVGSEGDYYKAEQLADYGPFDESPIELQPGESQALSVTYFDALYNSISGFNPDVVKWKSSDEGIATVNTDGRVTAVANGDAVITVTVQLTDLTGKVTTECKATVNIKVTRLTAEFIQDEINPTQLATLSVHGSVNISSVTADLSDFYDFEGAEKTPVPSLVPGKFEKTISVPANASGVYTVPVTVRLKNGKSVPKEATLNIISPPDTGFDWDEARIYFLLTDRFNGYTGSDSPFITGEFTGNAWINTGNYSYLNQYHGGSLDGVKAKLDYLQNLGINTVWVTPVVDNIDFELNNHYQGYAGYWAKTFQKLDEHMGSLEDLANGLHERGMKLMVDIVINHAGYEMNNFGTTSGITPLDLLGKFILPNGRSMFRVNNPDGRVQTELVGLPDFRTEDALVRDLLTKWQAKWVAAKDKNENKLVDYFRVDTVKHVENDTWRALKNAVVQENPDFKMIGELYAGYVDSRGASIEGGYTTEDYLAIDQLDSILDFDFKLITLGFVTGHKLTETKVAHGTEQIKVEGDGTISVSQTVSDLKKREAYFKANPMLSLGQFLSSHDEDSFITRVKTSDDTLKYSYLLNASSLQITSRGQPVIYYGEEIGQYGKYSNNSPSKYDENRYDFDWTLAGTNPLLLRHYQALLNSRDEYSKVFSKGERDYNTDYGTGDSVLSFVAYLNDKNNKPDPNQAVLVAINRSDADQTINFTGTVFPENSVLRDIYAEKRISKEKSYAYGAPLEVGESGDINGITVPKRSEGGVVVYVLDKDLKISGHRYVAEGTSDTEYTAVGIIATDNKDKLVWSVVDAKTGKAVDSTVASLEPVSNENDAGDKTKVKLNAAKAGKYKIKATVPASEENAAISATLDIWVVGIDGELVIPLDESTHDYEIIPDALYTDKKDAFATNVIGDIVETDSVTWEVNNSAIAEITPDESTAKIAKLSTQKTGKVTLTMTLKVDEDGKDKGQAPYDVVVSRDVIIAQITGDEFIPVNGILGASVSKTEFEYLLDTGEVELASPYAVEWELEGSASEGIASIGTSSGTVTPLADGKVTVTATVLNGDKAIGVISRKITILKVDGEDTTEVDTEEAYSLLPEIDDKTVTWSVTDASGGDVTAATIDSAGKFSASASGAYVIRATIADWQNYGDSGEILYATKTVTVPEEALVWDYEVTPESLSLDFGSEQAGYSEVPAAQTAKLLNTGTGTYEGISITLRNENASNFTIDVSVPEQLAPGDSAIIITVRPKTELSANSYSDEIIIISTNGDTPINAIIALTFEVTATEPDEPDFEISPEVLDFGEVTEGYNSVTSKAFTITNEGNAVLDPANFDISLSGKNPEAFEIDSLSDSIAVEGAASVNVKPKTGLDVGIYEATVTVTYNDGTIDKTLEISLTFEVEEAASQQPDRIRINQGATITISKGKTLTLTVAFVPESSASELRWTSSNTSFVTVGSATGVIKGIKSGTASITVTTANGKAAVISVRVI
ncbi:MAG: Ig-like domain-containing protein [Oscillospiraceae bacterium]|nr:Ig-like domain-containing protein [Oscillospiraceae bacterium]